MIPNQAWPRLRLVARSGAAVLMLAVGLVACGGGGGDDEAPAPIQVDTSYTVSFDKKSLAWTYAENSPHFSPSVMVFGQGSLTRGLYVGATNLSGKPDTQLARVNVVLNEATSTGTVTLVPVATLKTGIHTGTLLLNACADQACTTHYAGSPHRLDYSITVTKPAIETLPAEYTMYGQGAAQATIYVLPLHGVSPFTWTATSAAPWVTIDEVTNSSFRVTLNATTPGTHTTTVLLKSGEYEGSVKLTQIVP